MGVGYVLVLVWLVGLVGGEWWMEMEEEEEGVVGLGFRQCLCLTVM